MPTEFSDAALQEADAAIKASQAYQPSKGERVLNKIGGVVIGANSEYDSVVSNELATQGFSVVKDRVSNFVQNSKILMRALDEVAKAHPFIQVAVSLFKAGLTLELTRRENDDKVVALNLTMCDMMQVLTMLKQVADPKAPSPDGLTIQDRLKQRMGTIIDSIKGCAKVCDSYQKRHTAVKFFMSPKWQAKFTDVAQQFADHKTAIQFDLQLHMSVGIVTANLTLSALSVDMGRLTENVGKLMEVVFERMLSPEERKVASLIAAQPGGVEAALKNDALLKQVLDMQKSKEGKGKGARRHGGAGAEEDKTMTISDLRHEANEDVEKVLASNTCFDDKFRETVRIQALHVRGP